jgi:hypothetical protein
MLDYETFDNDTDDTTDEEYRAFVAWISEQTATQLRAVKGDADAQKQVLCGYYGRGESANLTASELIDFLAVDAYSILDAIDYSDAEAAALMKLSDGLTDDDIASASLS